MSKINHNNNVPENALEISEKDVTIDNIIKDDSEMIDNIKDDLLVHQILISDEQEKVFSDLLEVFQTITYSKFHISSSPFLR